MSLSSVEVPSRVGAASVSPSTPSESPDFSARDAALSWQSTHTHFLGLTLGRSSLLSKHL